MTAFITLNDDTGTCLDIEAIKAIVGLKSEEHGHHAVVIDRDGQQFNSPLTPSEIRGRMEAALRLSVN